MSVLRLRNTTTPGMGATSHAYICTCTYMHAYRPIYKYIHMRINEIKCLWMKLRSGCVAQYKKMLRL